MKIVGYKDSNGIELADGQHIKIYDKTDAYRLLVDGIIEYLPGAFMIHNNDGNDYLLFWYIRDNIDYDGIPNKEKYIIEVVK